MSSNKINVAVAGVTNGLGNAIAQALLANSHVGKVTLLTRASPSASVPDALEHLIQQGTVLRPVDYASVKDIAEALQGVHTVISTLYTPIDATPASNLIDGAKAAGVKRFAASEFAIAKEANHMIENYHTKLGLWVKLKASGMEYTAFRNGMFMDFFATGSELYKGPLVRMWPLVIDMVKRTAEIPGTGDEKITFTMLTDIGKFVSAAISFEQWPEEMGMSGDTLSYNEIVRSAEEVIGQKFTVTYLGREELSKNLSESLEKKDWIGQFLAEMFTAFIEGKGWIREPYLNKVTDVKPTTVAGFLKQYWVKA